MTSSSVAAPDPRHTVLDAIRRGCSTVNVLAAELSVTDNAVRLHLVALEADGLIARTGIRHSGRAGQPAAEYALTPAGETALSHAYPPVLAALVAALGARLELRTLRAVMADAGTRIAAVGGRSPAAGASLSYRAGQCVSLIQSLGGSATVELGRHEAIITGAGCPLSAAVRAEPGSCTIIEALLASHAGVKATQHCDHGAHPNCRFAIQCE